MRRLLKEAEYELSQEELNSLDTSIDEIEGTLMETIDEENLNLKENIRKCLEDHVKTYRNKSDKYFLKAINKDDSDLIRAIKEIIVLHVINKNNFDTSMICNDNTWRKIAISILKGFYPALRFGFDSEDEYFSIFNIDEICTDMKNDNDPQIKIMPNFHEVFKKLMMTELKEQKERTEREKIKEQKDKDENDLEVTNRILKRMYKDAKKMK